MSPVVIEMSDEETPLFWQLQKARSVADAAAEAGRGRVEGSRRRPRAAGKSVNLAICFLNKQWW